MPRKHARSQLLIAAAAVGMLLAVSASVPQHQDFVKDAMENAEAIHFRCRFAMEWFGQRFDQRGHHACNPKVRRRAELSGACA